LCHPDRVWGPQNFLFNGCQCSFLGVKRPKREVDHLPHLIRWLRLSGTRRLLPPYAFMTLTGATVPIPFSCVDLKKFHIFQRTFTILHSGQYGQQCQCHFVSPLKRIKIHAYAYVSFGLIYVPELWDLPSYALERRCHLPIDCSSRSMSCACFHEILQIP
jgi:hypothetical protein